MKYYWEEADNIVDEMFSTLVLAIEIDCETKADKIRYF